MNGVPQKRGKGHQLRNVWPSPQNEASLTKRTAAAKYFVASITSIR